MKFSVAVATALCIASTAASASDLFEDGKPVSIPKGTLIHANTTVGGYALYQGDAEWLFLDAKDSLLGGYGGADSINIGRAILVAPSSDKKMWAATMLVGVNLSFAGQDQYFTGSPCAGAHLVAVSKSNGRDDNCLTIDSKALPSGPSKQPALLARVVQSSSSGRVYSIELSINPEAFGFINTTPDDWKEVSYKADPARLAFIGRLAKWGDFLQDATREAIGFKQPKDAFKTVPPLSYLANNKTESSGNASSN